jgi:hypothetical protein
MERSKDITCISSVNISNIRTSSVCVKVAQCVHFFDFELHEGQSSPDMIIHVFPQKLHVNSLSLEKGEVFFKNEYILGSFLFRSFLRSRNFTEKFVCAKIKQIKYNLKSHLFLFSCLPD